MPSLLGRVLFKVVVGDMGKEVAKFVSSYLKS